MSLALFGAGVSGRLPQRSNIFCAVVILLLAMNRAGFGTQVFSYHLPQQRGCCISTRY